MSNSTTCTSPTSSRDEKYKTLFTLLKPRPDEYLEPVDTEKLANKINSKTKDNKNISQLIINIMRQDSLYSESNMNEYSDGVCFDLNKLSEYHVQLLYSIADKVIK